MNMKVRGVYVCSFLTSMSRDLDDSSASWAVTRDTFHATKSTKSKARSQTEAEYIGPQVIRFDQIRTQSWDLISHGGFLTWPHHDANGLCTFMQVQSGMKIWGMLDLKPPAAGETPGGRSEVMEWHKAVVEENDAYLNATEGYNVFLEAGDFMYVITAFSIFVGHFHTIYLVYNLPDFGTKYTHP